MSLQYSDNFPPQNLNLGEIVTLVGKANACLSRYDGLLESLVNPEVLLSPLVMKEAELSSRIEGTIATANEVYQQQAGEKFNPEKSADIQWTQQSEQIGRDNPSNAARRSENPQDLE